MNDFNNQNQANIVSDHNNSFNQSNQNDQFNQANYSAPAVQSDQPIAVSQSNFNDQSSTGDSQNYSWQSPPAFQSNANPQSNQDLKNESANPSSPTDFHNDPPIAQAHDDFSQTVDYANSNEPVTEGKMDFSQDNSPSQDFQPKIVDEVASSSASNPSSETNSDVSEEIADQNIFEMLGVTDGTTEQREQFLDELQAVIWDDFIEHDTKLLLTDEEQQELRKILDPDPKSAENQEKAVIYLEKLIPDLEEIMLEKALQLKEEMARERLRAMQELHSQDPQKTSVINQAQQAMNEKKWNTATKLLNSLSK